MRIVYLHQYFRTPSQNGGVRSYHFARALAERGHEVHVVTAGVPSVGESVDPAPALPFLVHYLDVPYDNSMGVLRRLRAFTSFAVRASTLARRLRGDVVIATSTPLTVAVPGIWATLGRRSSMVFEIRDSWPDVPIALGALRHPLLRRAARLLEHVAVTRAAKVVALSDGMAEGAVAAGAAAADVVVIPNIADVDAFAPERATAAEWLAEHPELRGRRIAVYCGTFGLVNGLSAMVDLAAASKSRGSDLAFVAIGDGRERDDVVARARRLGVLGDNFFVFDGVPKHRLPDVLAAACVAISFVIDVPALEQNSANKFFDALASGTPLAINHGGWQSDVLERHGVGLRLDRDASVAARQLIDFTSDPDALASSARAARLLAVRDYSLTDLAERFCDVVDGSAPARR